MDSARPKARALAQEHLKNGDPLGWFEALYAGAQDDAAHIPWADCAPNPNLVEWMAREAVAGENLKALVVGCGLGDDAEALAQRGFETTAFDIAQSAIKWCRKRFPESKVRYACWDLFELPADQRDRYGLVVESYTLQVLPPDLRQDAMWLLAGLLAPGGTLLVICRGRDADDPSGELPWPLTRDEFGTFVEAGLAESSFEDYIEAEEPPVRRFRATYRKE